MGSKDVSCNKLIVEQQLNNNYLSGPYLVNINHIKNEVKYIVHIEQYGIRQLTITAETNVPSTHFISLFQDINTLIMLFEGRFVPVTKFTVFLNEIEVTDDIIKKLNQTPFPMYTSASNFLEQHLFFCNYADFLTDTMPIEWQCLKDELDIVHSVMLYQFSDNGMPVDFRCAVIIECFESISELLEIKNIYFKLPRNKQFAVTLRNCLNSVISYYGSEIFSKEIKTKKNEFISILRNSRVRIMHIKRKCPDIYLTGAESVLYSWKLQLLYRKILLNLLGVNNTSYIGNLLKAIDFYNQWNSVVDDLLKRL